MFSALKELNVNANTADNLSDTGTSFGSGRTFNVGGYAVYENPNFAGSDSAVAVNVSNKAGYVVGSVAAVAVVAYLYFFKKRK